MLYAPHGFTATYENTAANRTATSLSIRKILCLALSALLAVGACLPMLAVPRVAQAADAAAANDGKLVVAIDPGHGGNDPGASGNGVVEAETNWDIAQACIAELRTYAGVEVVLTQSNTENLNREERILSAVAQGADVVVSIHCNSADGAPSANGCEAWVPNDSPYLYQETHVVGTGLGNNILNELSALGISNRGVKTRDCTDDETYPDNGGPCDWYGINYWARWNGICGIIIEHAFVTNASDAAKLKDADWRKKMGVADATGIAKYYGLTKDQGDSGSQGDQSGNQEPTEQPSVDVSKVGEAVSTSYGYDGNPSIMGEGKATAAEMAAWFTSKKASFPADVYTQFGAATIEEFCTILIEEAQAEGVRSDVAFVQAMNETGWLRFGGQVKVEQCNFCGLGALDGGAAGADFSEYGEEAVRMGLRAQIQHLKAYASTEALANECIDPRFDKVTRGVAPFVRDLAGKWATNPAYGESLVALLNDLLGARASQEGVTDVKVGLADVPEALLSEGTATVYVDGVAAKLDVFGDYGCVELSGSDTEPKSIVLYEHNNAGASDPHAVYPTHMYAWVATADDSGYSVQRHYGFDDMLRYAGSSIRITGTKGIRMRTGMSENLKTALSGEGVLGYTLVETGTLLAWSDKVENGSLTFDTQGASRGKAYVAESQNPVFGRTDGVEYYTNVLVGFNTAEQYKRDLAMRPYAILADAAGNQLTVYGGVVHRSIGYIAEQNADAFAAGSAAYEFIHGIIDACKE